MVPCKLLEVIKVVVEDNIFGKPLHLCLTTWGQHVLTAVVLVTHAPVLLGFSILVGSSTWVDLLFLIIRIIARLCLQEKEEEELGNEGEFSYFLLPFPFFSFFPFFFLLSGVSVYGEKRISVQNEDGSKVEYRVWNPFCSKLAAAILGGVDNIWIAPGTRILYLGVALGTTVSHMSDLVGPTGVVFAVD
ncbi:uncharacterized protein LOC109714606 [Ananas comosus]|uniref:rRNA 2'-O-methyltransferase fibrillarin n=1 Tax=Ananas comosus TaxID=4615 RepID=A0A6P5FP93_ANACO|nr:uncharacterized protein LOC109714606 [Ananas comosus]